MKLSVPLATLGREGKCKPTITSIHTKKEEDVTWSHVIILLIEKGKRQEVRLKEPNEEHPGTVELLVAMFGGNQKRPIVKSTETSRSMRCYYCHKIGHTRRYRRAGKKYQS